MLYVGPQGTLTLSNEVSSNQQFQRHQKRKISLLNHYIENLRNAEHNPPDKDGVDYQMPADFVSEDEWAEFDNVYQIHAPKLFFDSAIRDVSRHPSRKYHVLTGPTST